MKNSLSIFSIALLFVSVISHAEEVSAERVSAGNQEKVWAYSVLKNDSFERIYQKYLNKRANIIALSAYNHHPLSKKLQPAQIINIPVEMLRRIPTHAQVLLVYGDVNTSSIVGGDTHQVKKDDLFVAGDSLATGKNSLAKLLFADGSKIDIQSNSNLSIQDSYQYVGKETFVTNLKLVKGRTQVSANPEHTLGNTLQIQTPSAVAAVRGTQFRVAAEENVSLQETLEGRVAFSASGQEVLLAKGYGSLAEKDKAPLPPIQLPSAPDVSRLPKLFELNSAEFNFLAQQGVVAWIGQLALDEDFTQILSEQMTQSGKLIFADLIDGQYYLKLRTQDQNGLQSMDAIHVFHVKALPPEPLLELLEPLDGAVIPLAPTNLSWTPVPTATNYLVQVARDVNFTDNLYERHSSYNKLTINQSFGAGMFYWRVATLSAGKPQKFSNIRTFSR
ncbi:FecR domain-containing protein [Methylotenera sp.]|uniref:FecR family protein n=1 Tax=Methylotenera sp. TaxID=2051956 RepID=UPI002487A25C|nr:FecR domain-containing protein [Methylotenera sp.]MDI1300070.1 FecR domain-containing protein [Methylotenera sp.]